MKLLLELIVIGTLVFLGWRTPFRQYYERFTPQAKAAPGQSGLDGADPTPEVASVSIPKSTPDSKDWMWKRTKIDPLTRPDR